MTADQSGIKFPKDIVFGDMRLRYLPPDLNQKYDLLIFFCSQKMCEGVKLAGQLRDMLTSPSISSFISTAKTSRSVPQVLRKIRMSLSLRKR